MARKSKRAKARAKRMLRTGGFSGSKGCRFCADHGLELDYKETKTLRHYISETGAIVPRRVSGTCAKHQRKVTTAVKRARVLALVPFANRAV